MRPFIKNASFYFNYYLKHTIIDLSHQGGTHETHRTILK